MDPILAAGVLNIGRSVVDKIFPSSSSNATADFSTVLSAENGIGAAKAGGVPSATDAASEAETLEIRLGHTTEVSSFLKGEKSFTLRPDGDGFLIERSDGATLELPEGSVAERLARELDTARRSERQLLGNPALAPSDTAWAVSLTPVAQRSSNV